MTDSTSTITLELSCHCKTFKHNVTFPTSKLPLKAAICHCSVCQRAIGQLWGAYAVMPVDIDMPSTAGLAYYQHSFVKSDGKSEPGIKRYFCTTCGATVFHDEVVDWEICTGVVDKAFLSKPGDDKTEATAIDGLFDRVELFAKSPSDGGGAIWVNGGKSVGMERHKDGRSSALVTDQDIQTWLSYKAPASSQKSDGEYVFEGACACGSVKFEMHTAGKRLPGALCACTSCRKTIGFDISSWVTIPKSDITVHGEHLFDSTGGEKPSVETAIAGKHGITHYVSSPNTSRYFCKGCGCKLMFCKDDATTCDVNAGIFVTATEGARRERWIDWHSPESDAMGFREEAIDKKYVLGVYDGVMDDRNRRNEKQ